MADSAPRPNPLRDVRVATAFLTRIPTGWIDCMRTADLAAAAWAFPVIGLGVGALAGGVLYAAAGANLHPLACALLALAVQAVVTGALHEDGLADTADALGGAGRDRALEIMRDSRIGSYGVLALIFSIGIRAAVLAGIAGPSLAWLAMIVAAALSRGILPLIMHLMPPARPDGLAKGAGKPTQLGAGLSLGIGIAAMVLIAPLSVAMWTLVLSVPAIALITMWALRRLGGHTGDVLGALQQITETAVLIAATGWSLSTL